MQCFSSVQFNYAWFLTLLVLVAMYLHNYILNSGLGGGGGHATADCRVKRLG